MVKGDWFENSEAAERKMQPQHTSGRCRASLTAVKKPKNLAKGFSFRLPSSWMAHVDSGQWTVDSGHKPDYLHSEKNSGALIDEPSFRVRSRKKVRVRTSWATKVNSLLLALEVESCQGWPKRASKASASIMINPHEDQPPQFSDCNIEL